MNSEIGAITCFAKNCVFHKGNNACTAGTIEVGNASACKCGETQCKTFRLNENAVGEARGCCD